MKISNALGIELSDFFSEKMFLHNEIDPISMQILHQLKNQDDEVKEIILQLIKQAIKLRAT